MYSHLHHTLPYFALPLQTEKADKIKAEYAKAMETIDQLRGVNRTKAEQMKEITQLQQAQESARLRVLDLERKLRGLEVNIVEELEKSLPNDIFGIK